MSQWSSYFAETGLKVSKMTGDLLGPCLFAILMGTGRMIFGFVGEKKKFITQEGSKVISDIILYFVTPCLIINSLNIKFDTNKLKGLIICFVAFSLIQVFSIVLSTLLFKKAK